MHGKGSIICSKQVGKPAVREVEMKSFSELHIHSVFAAEISSPTTSQRVDSHSFTRATWDFQEIRIIAWY
jgi:hypothetical protein